MIIVILLNSFKIVVELKFVSTIFRIVIFQSKILPQTACFLKSPMAILANIHVSVWILGILTRLQFHDIGPLVQMQVCYISEVYIFMILTLWHIHAFLVAINILRISWSCSATLIQHTMEFYIIHLDKMGCFRFSYSCIKAYVCLSEDLY